MEKYFDAPTEILEYIALSLDFIVAARIKPYGCPKSIKLVNPKFDISGVLLNINAQNIRKSLQVPVALIEDLEMVWEMLGRKGTDYMRTNQSYFRDRLPQGWIEDALSYTNNMGIISREHINCVSKDDDIK